jgi:oligopeptide/dipeptide ABC transporter ATP-binding protein
MNVLKVKNLSIAFDVERGVLPAVSDLSFSVGKGEIVAIVGESGCGKSVTCMALARLLPEPPARFAAGSIELVGKSVLELNSKELRELRRDNISYIFQEPSASLNPVFKVGDQIAEAIELRSDGADVREEVVELMRRVGIPAPEQRSNSYPHEMSGGMQQRVMIAMALAGKPDLLVADEPTTALDVTIQAQILDLLREIRDTSDMSIILVTHNLGIVADMADRVVVMYAGHTVESGKTRDVIDNPLHPYTKALLAAVPKLGNPAKTLNTIPGAIPSIENYTKGCRFFGRCALAAFKTADETILCENNLPEWRETIKGRFCRCHY